MKLLTLTVLGAIFINGCSSAPTYIRPVAPVPEKLALYQSEDSQWVTSWNNVINESSLSKLIQLGLKHNRDLQLALLNVQAYQAQYQIQSAQQYPEIMSTSSITRQRTPVTTERAQSNITSTNTTTLGIASYEIDFWGRIKNLKGVALETYLAQQSAKDNIQSLVIANIAEAYINLLADQDLLMLSQSTQQNYQQNLELVQQRYQAGLSSALELAQAKSNVHNVKTNMLTYQRQVELDRNALQLLVGSEVPWKELSTKLSKQVDILKPLRIGISSSQLLNRPDVIQAEHELMAANANIGAARAAFFPTITLTTNTGVMSSSFNNLFDTRSKTWLFQPSIDLPIFDWGNRNANLELAKVKENTQIANYEKVIQIAFREVADGVISQQALIESLHAQQDLVSTNTSYYELAKSRYEQGIDNYMTLLDAQRSLFVANQSLITAKKLYLLNRIQLFKAIGGT